MLRYRQFKIVAVAIFLGLAAAGCRHAAAAKTGAPDAAVNRLLDALGGRRRLDRIRFLRFDITRQFDNGAATRQFYWLDRERDLCHVEGTRRKTDSRLSAVMNLKTGQGAAFVGLRAKSTNEPALIRELIDESLADTDWLLGFARWGEPGSRIKRAGMSSMGGQDCPTVDLNLIGPPRRNYLLHLAPDGKSLAGWTVVEPAQGNQPTTYQITQWYEVRGVRLPVRFERLSGPGARLVLIDKLYAPGAIDEQVFLRP